MKEVLLCDQECTCVEVELVPRGENLAVPRLVLVELRAFVQVGRVRGVGVVHI